MWDLFVILLSLVLLMYTAYRGFSVILMAPLCALLAVFLINPRALLHKPRAYKVYSVL